MAELILPSTGMLYFTTRNTGGSLDLRTPEGVMQFRREDPHGVLAQVAGGLLQFSIQKQDLAAIARFFAAAGTMLGEPINDGWDKP